jgi:hypothetical protein
MSILIRLITLACISSILLSGCARAYVRPPYAEDPPSKADAQCQKQASNGPDCKKAGDR